MRSRAQEAERLEVRIARAAESRSERPQLACVDLRPARVAATTVGEVREREEVPLANIPFATLQAPASESLPQIVEVMGLRGHPDSAVRVHECAHEIRSRAGRPDDEDRRVARRHGNVIGALTDCR